MPSTAPRSAHTVPQGWPLPPARTALVMGVLNLTPDSFSDGGAYTEVDAAIGRGLALEAEGADILDIGGESTRPGASPISGEEEVARVLPVLKGLAQRLTIPLSIDTYKASTARAALAHGASIVNDIWGLQRDPEMAHVVADTGAGLCIMHNRPAIDPALDIIADMRDFFARSLAIAAQAGIARDKIVLDPGIGFGKTYEQNLICLNRLEALHGFGLPLLVGCSRKGFIGAITGRKVAAERLAGSLSAHVAAALKGAAYIRAHDVAAHKDALALVSAITRESSQPAKAPA